MSKESKFLSRVLSNEPELVEVTLGPGGWVLVDDLLRGMRRSGLRLKRDDLDRIAAENEKCRFRLSENGRHARSRNHSDQKN